MKKVLVKFNSSFCDEFDTFGFEVITYEQLAIRLEETKRIFDIEGNLDIYVFTNEAIIFDSYDEWFDTITLVGITDTEADFIINTFGSKVGQVLWV